MSKVERYNRIIISGIILNQPESVVKNSPGATPGNGVVNFKMINTVILSQAMIKDNPFFVNLYVRDCVNIAKQLHIGDHVLVDGKFYSTGGDKSYLNISADSVMLLKGQGASATPENAIKMNEAELMDELL